MRGGWRGSERSVAHGAGRPLLVVAVYAVLAVLVIFVFPHFVSPNELSRWLLDASIVTATNLLHLVARPLALAVPFVLIAAVTIAAHRRNTLYVIVGALLALVVGFREQSPIQRLQRAYVAEVYFERRGSLPRTLPGGLQRRRAAELQLPPPSWPF